MRKVITFSQIVIAMVIICQAVGMVDNADAGGRTEASENAMVSGKIAKALDAATGSTELRQTCPGVTLYGHEPTDPSSGWACYTSDVGPSDGPFIVYDDYFNAQGITALKFFGIEAHNPGTGWQSCSESPLPFEIVFYTDDAGQPGSVTATYNVSLAGIGTGVFYNSVFELMEFETQLSPAPPAGTESGWLSIQASGDPDCWFLWANSPSGDNSAYQWDGSTLNQLDDDLAFCLMEDISVDFAADPKYIRVHENVSFTDLTESLNPITDWHWDFGDDMSSDEENPVHQYSTSGSYDIMLRVSDGNMVDSLSREGLITVVDSSEWITFDISTTDIPAAWDMRTVDLDRDNNNDLVFSYWTHSGIQVAYGRGDGTFDPLQSYLSGTFQALDFAFIDGDSLIDMIVVEDGYVAIMLNQGQREFSSSLFSCSAGATPAVASGFFNNDNFIDFAVTPGAIYFGDGQGGFVYHGSTPRQFNAVDVSEFNADGKDDLIVASDSMIVLLNDGNGNFSRSWALPTGYTSYSVTTARALADFNRDGKRDFAALIPPLPPLSGSTLLVGLGDGTGGMQEVKSIEIDGIAYQVTAADLDRDRCLDLAAADGGDREVEIFFGDGTGNFSYPAVIDPQTSQIVWNIAAADFDRDGNSDIALSGGAVTVGELIVAINLLPDTPVLQDEMVTSGYGTVSVEILNPDSFTISRDFITVAGADYWRYNLDDDSIHDESAVDYNMLYGEYLIQVSPRPGAEPGADFSIGIGINGSLQLTIFHNYFLPHAKDPSQDSGYSFYYTVEPTSSIQPPNGLPNSTNPPTCDWSGLVASGTFDFQLDRYFDFSGLDLISETGLSQPAYSLPDPLGVDSVYYWRFRLTGDAGWSRTFALYMADYQCGDADGNSIVNISDAVYLISYIFGGGPAPVPLISGDTDCNEITNISDAVYLISYIFGGGPSPCQSCP